MSKTFSNILFITLGLLFSSFLFSLVSVNNKGFDLKTNNNQPGIVASGTGFQLTPFDYYVQQGDGTKNAGTNCGPAVVSMAIRYGSALGIQPSLPNVRRDFMKLSDGKFALVSNMENAMRYVGANFTELKNGADDVWAAINRSHVVMVPIRMRDITMGEDIIEAPSGKCSIGKKTYQVGDKVYCYSDANSVVTGKYVDFNISNGQWDGHWVLVNGIYTDSTGQRYFYVYDPDVFGSSGSKYFYFNQLPKGKYRLWKFEELGKGLMNNGNIAIEVNHNPANPIPEPSALDQNQITQNPSLALQTGQDSIQFLFDVNYPSGSTLNPGQTVMKTWQVQNIGTTDIGLEYRLIQMSGPSVQSYGESLTGEVLSGQTFNISTYITAPNDQGTLSTTWKVIDPYGNPISGDLSFSFVVSGTSSNSFDNGNFIADITLPDNILLLPGQSLTKTWRMKNTGSTTWGSGYQLVFTRGDHLNAPAAVDVPSTVPGQTADLSVGFTSPGIDGNYQGYWRLRNPQGTYFGDEIWVKINVKASSGHISILETDPASPATANKVRIHAVADNFANLRAMRILVDGNVISEIGAPEIWADWDTSGYSNGTHIITALAADWTDLNWAHPDVKGLVFTLQGNNVSVNHAPNVPTPTNPGDWAVYTGTSGINLSAQANGDLDPGDTIVQYDFEIFESHDNPKSDWISSNTWSPPGLSTFGYQWHVKVRDNHGAESGWSEPRHFTVNDPSPQIYSFTAQPCRASWNQGDPDKICFCAQTNAGTLQLQLNSATDGSVNGNWKIINELGTSNYSCNLDSDSPPTLDPKELESGLHVVRLYARKDGGWLAAKTQDIPISVGNLRPNPPGAQTLTNGAYTNSQDVSLIWSSTQRTSNYRVEVSTDASFTTHLADQTLPSSQTKLDLHLNSPFATVYWRVTANGPYGSNSATNVFHIDVTPPDTSLSVPANTVYENNFVVNWSGSDTEAGFQWYHLQSQDISRPDIEWQDWLVDTSQTLAIFEGQPGHTYLIRIRGMDNVGNWQDWPAGNGLRQVSVKIDPTTRPLAPWWKTGYSYKRNLVILNNDTGSLPSHFPVHLHLDGSSSPTAAEIYNACQSPSKYNDINIVYNDTTEIQRFIENFSASQIDIWFPLTAEIPGGASDSSSYQLYYGNPNPDIPLMDLAQVFIPVADGNTVGLWHFQDGAGSTVLDSSGRNHTGTFNNPGWTDGFLGRAGLFNGINSGVNLGNSTDFNLTAMTIEAWVYVNSGWSGYWPVIATKTVDGQTGGFELRLTDTRQIRFLVQTPQGSRWMISSIALQTNRWYHIAAVHNGIDHQYIYINGVESGNTASNVPNFNNAPVTIGYSTNASSPSYFPGQIQHVRISNIARYDFPYAKINTLPKTEPGGLQTPPITAKPDLSILGINTYPNTGGGLLVEVAVKNLGTVSMMNGFYTDLYLDHIPSGSGDLTGSFRFWINDPIAAGASANLTTVITDLTQLGLTTSLLWVEKSGTLYSQVDSTGLIPETDKSNNISQTGTAVCVAATDGYEDDNTPANAKLITVKQGHNFNSPGDQDWVKFNANAGQTYNIHTNNLGPSSDTYLYLYNIDGTTLLASNDDSNNSLASQIQWTAPASGTYFVRVSDWNPNIAGCGTSYELSVAALPGPFSKLSPAIGDGANISPTLSWGTSASATFYIYCTDTIDNGACDSSWMSTGTNTIVALTNLTNSTTYYWQVCALNNAGEMCADDDAWWNFTTNAADVQGNVTLQGRPAAPDPSWSIPLSVSLTIPGNSQPSYTFSPTTDTSGKFDLTGIAPDTYEIRVKQSHTLRNLKTVTLAAGANTIDFGTLLEGDANDDGFVTLQDFSTLVTTYGKCQGISGYDSRADFNMDTCVTLLDFSLLVTNYGKGGDMAVTGGINPEGNNQATDAVSIRVDPPQSNVFVGDTFTVSILVQAGSQTADGAQVGLDFDPTKLQVKQITGNTALLPQVLQNTYDNTKGTLDYAAGTFSNFPSGNFTLVQIEFKAIGGTAGTSLTFHQGAPGNTDITFGGKSVLTSRQDGTVKSDYKNKVFLPMTIR